MSIWTPQLYKFRKLLFSLVGRVYKFLFEKTLSAALLTGVRTFVQKQPFRAEILLGHFEIVTCFVTCTNFCIGGVGNHDFNCGSPVE